MDPRTQQLPANRGKKKPRVELLCPYGCGESQVNAVGYCDHLVGFTLDKRHMEVRTFFGEGKDHERVSGSQPVLETDIVVEMATPTCRVYRGGPDDVLGDVKRQGQGEGDDNAQMIALLLEQNKQMQEQIDALKAALAKP